MEGTLHVREAYTGRTVEWNGERAGPPLLPCLASTIVELEGEAGVRLSSRKCTRRGLGEMDVCLKRGAHAFVLLPGEDVLQVGIVPYVWGHAAGHPHLSGPSPSPVLFAGAPCPCEITPRS